MAFDDPYKVIRPDAAGIAGKGPAAPEPPWTHHDQVYFGKVTGLAPGAVATAPVMVDTLPVRWRANLPEVSPGVAAGTFDDVDPDHHTHQAVAILWGQVKNDSILMCLPYDDRLVSIEDVSDRPCPRTGVIRLVGPFPSKAPAVGVQYFLIRSGGSSPSGPLPGTVLQSGVTDANGEINYTYTAADAIQGIYAEVLMTGPAGQECIGSLPSMIGFNACSARAEYTYCHGGYGMVVSDPVLFWPALQELNVVIGATPGYNPWDSAATMGFVGGTATGKVPCQQVALTYTGRRIGSPVGPTPAGGSRVGNAGLGGAQNTWLVGVCMFFPSSTNCELLKLVQGWARGPLEICPPDSGNPPSYHRTTTTQCGVADWDCGAVPMINLDLFHIAGSGYEDMGSIVLSGPTIGLDSTGAAGCAEDCLAVAPARHGLLKDTLQLSLVNANTDPRSGPIHSLITLNYAGEFATGGATPGGNFPYKVRKWSSGLLGPDGASYTCLKYNADVGQYLFNDVHPYDDAYVELVVGSSCYPNGMTVGPDGIQGIVIINYIRVGAGCTTPPGLPPRQPFDRTIFSETNVRGFSLYCSSYPGQCNLCSPTLVSLYSAGVGGITGLLSE